MVRWIELLLYNVKILVLCQQSALFDTFLAFKNTCLYYHIFLIIYDGVKLLAWHSQQIADLVRQRTEVPDVSHRNNQVDMSHSLAAHLLLCYLDTATVADNTFVTYSLVLSAVALVILSRTEDSLAKQTVSFWLVCTIVYSFRLQNLTK